MIDLCLTLDGGTREIVASLVPTVNLKDLQKDIRSTPLCNNVSSLTPLVVRKQPKRSLRFINPLTKACSHGKCKS